MRTIFQLFAKYSGIIAVVLISLLAVSDLMHYGIPPTHDGEYHIMRFWQFNKNIEDGVLYPRWAPDFNNGFGVPLFTYVYPLPNYFSSLLNFLNFGLIESLKINFAFTSIIGAVLFYLWAKEYWGNIGGVVSSVYYTFSPYHFLDIYVRGSVGEVWSLAIFPGLLFFYLRYIKTQNSKNLFLSSIFLALLVFSHNILALLFFAMFIVYSLFLMLESKKYRQSILGFICVTLIGLGLSSPFWLPALFETKYVSGLQLFDPTEHFPKIYQLIYSSWGYGFSGIATGAEGQMSFQIGIANLIAVVIVTVLAFLTRKKIIIFFLILFFSLVFLITPFSEIIWKTVPLISYVQFPWRLLSGVIVASSFLAGSIVWERILKKKRDRIIVAILLILVSVGFGIRYAKAPFYHERNDSHYLSRSNFTDGTNSPGDLFNTYWLSSVPPKRKLSIDDGNIKVIKSETSERMYKIYTQKDQIFYPNIAYFPNWVVYVNKVKKPIINDNGLIGVRIEKGDSLVTLSYQTSPIEKLSYILFCLSVFFLVFIKYYIVIIKKWL